jgi:hypothetical protein
MKIKAYLGKEELELEVYKVQVALFGGPSVLIYNEDRTQRYEVHSIKEVKAIRKFIGNKTVKAYVAGNLNEDGQIVMQKLIPRSISKDYTW